MIKNPNDIVQELTSDYLAVLGDDLKSVIMYGSAVSHEFRPGKSSIVLAFVVNKNPISLLSRCTALHRKWSRRGVATPLFLTPAYIASSLDSYPAEFFDMQTNYRILYGDDVLKPLQIEKKYLRLQCEREFKGIAVHLRSAFLDAFGKEQRMRELLTRALEKMLPLFKALLALGNRKIPAMSGEIVSSVEDMLGLGAGALSQVHGEGPKRGAMSIDLFDRFTAAVDAIAAYIDTLDEQEIR
jgi:hypothetical protein